MQAAHSPERNAEGLTVQMMVRLTPDDRAALGRIAEADERPMGWLIRRAVREYLNQRDGARN